MQPDLYRIMCNATADESRRDEFRSAVREFLAVCREPSILILAGAAAGAVMAAVLVAVAHR